MKPGLVCLLVLFQLTGCVPRPGPDSGADAGVDGGSRGEARDAGPDLSALQGCSASSPMKAVEEGLTHRYLKVLFAWGAAPTDVWALRGLGSLATELARWDGTQWTVVQLPQPGEMPTVIAGSSARDVWFGGATGLSYHWDGSSLSHVDTASPLPTRGIQAPGPNEAWALSSESSSNQGALQRWDGSTWSVAARFPLAGMSDLPDTFWVSGTGEVWLASSSAVYRWHEGAVERVLTEGGPTALWGSGTGDVWVTRDSGLKRWNGSALEPVEGSPRAWAIWGTGPQDVWFIGIPQGSSSPTGLIHWDGSHFVFHASPQLASGAVSLRGTGPQDVWATTSTQLLRWDGQVWTRVSDGPPMTSSQPARVWPVGPGDLWTYEPTFDRVHHWDGQVRTLVPKTGEERPTYEHLQDVWANSPTDVWAVGNSGAAVHFDGVQWSPVPTGTTATLMGVGGTGADNVWAVGQEGTVLHWNGQVWTRVDAGTSVTLQDVWVGPDGFVIAVGDGGTVVQRQQGRWSALSGASGNLTSVWGWNPDDVWISNDMWGVFHSDGSSLSVELAPTAYHTYSQGIWGLGRDSLIASGLWIHDGQKQDFASYYIYNIYDVWMSPGGSVWLAHRTNRPLTSWETLSHTEGNCLVQYELFSTGFDVPGTARAMRAMHGAGEHDIWAVGLYGRIYHVQW